MTKFSKTRAVRFLAVPAMALAVMAGTMTASAPKAEALSREGRAALAVGLIVGAAAIAANSSRREGRRGWSRARFGGGGFGRSRCFTRQICSPDGWCETRSVC
jgi:hypothetical protein